MPITRLSGEDFDLHENNQLPIGITGDTGIGFRIVDRTDNKAYAYYGNGDHNPDDDFDLNPNNSTTAGITRMGSFYYVTNDADDRVYKYNLAGLYQSRFSLTSGHTDPNGITNANGRLYVLDGHAMKVFAYEENGTRAAAYDFNLEADAMRGISFVNDRFFTICSLAGRWMIDVFNENGVHIPEETTDTGLTLTTGLFAASDNKIYITNRDHNEVNVFQYTNPDTDYWKRTPENDVTVGVNVLAACIGFDNKLFAVISGGVRVYNPDGTRSGGDERSFTTSGIRGIEHDGDHFYIVRNGRVYTRTNIFTAETELFNLSAANQDPDGIFIHDNRIYVGDRQDEKTYAYNFSGNPQAGHEFNFNIDNEDSEHLAFINGYILSLDNADNRVYAYKPTGNTFTYASTRSLQDSGNLDTAIAGREDQVWLYDGNLDIFRSYNFDPYELIDRRMTSRYDINNAVTDTVTSEYAIEERVEDDITSGYSINEELAQTSASRYGILNSVEAGDASRYGILERVEDDVTSRYGLKELPQRFMVADDADDMIKAFDVVGDELVAQPLADIPNTLATRGMAGLKYDMLVSIQNDINRIDRDGNAVSTLSLQSANSPVQGMDIHNNKLYVLNAGSNRRVYVYDLPSNSFDGFFSISVGNPRAIVVINGTIYVSIVNSLTIYAHALDGTRIESSDFTVDLSSLHDIRGLAHIDGRLLVGSQTGFIFMFDFANRNDQLIDSLETNTVNACSTQYYYPVTRTGSQYDVLNSVENTRMSGYGILKSVALTITSRYNIIVFELASVLASGYGIIERASKTATSRYGITGRIRQTLQSRYGILVRLANMITSQYGTVERLTKTTTAQYGILEQISRAITSRYDTFNDIANDITARYNILTRASGTISSRYGIIGRIMQTIPSMYVLSSIRSRMRSFVSSFTLESRISSSPASRYGILSKIPRTITSQYETVGRAVKAMASSYGLVGRATKTIASRYSSIGRAIKTITSQYGTVGRISGILASRYGIIETIRNMVTGQYSVMGRISKDIASQYDALNSLARTIASRYGILAGITKTLASRYGIIGRISRILDSAYSLNSVIRAFISSFMLETRISSSPASRYGILGRIQKSMESRYGILYKITKALTSQYGMMQRISGMRDSAYHILERITDTVTSQYTTDEKRKRFLVHDTTDDMVHTYDLTNGFLVEDPLLHFLFPEASGMAGDGTDIWAVENHRNTAIKYDREGTEIDSFALESTNFPEQGCAIHNNKLYVINAGSTRRIFRYDLPSKSFDAMFTISVGNPRAMIIINGIIYIAVISDSTLYAHSLDGTRMAASDYSPTFSGDIRGMAYDNGNLLLATNDTIYLFDFTGRNTSPFNTITGHSSIDSATTQTFYPVTRLTSRYGVLDRTMRTITSRYGILEKIVRTLASVYHILNLLDVLRGFNSSYGLEARRSVSTASRYRLPQRISRAVTSQYDTLARLARTIASRYGIIQFLDVIKSTISSFNLEARVTASKISRYNIINKISNMLTSRYGILSGLPRTISSQYGVLKGISGSMASGYDILNSASNTITSRFRVIGRILKTILSEYFVSGEVLSTKTATATLLNPLVIYSTTLVNPNITYEAEIEQ